MADIDAATYPQDLVVVGRVNGVFGTRGWLKIYSYTRPRDNIFSYALWKLSDNGNWRSFEVVAHRRQGAGLIVSLVGVADRDAAVAWIGSDIAVDRDMLPENAAAEYYWADLIGLDVVNQQGASFGKVTGLLETGANDVLVVDGSKRRLIPFVKEHYVMAIDLDGGRMVVDWHEDD